MDKSPHDEMKGKKYEGSFWNFSDKNAAELQREIEHTRADLDETVNALQAKLDPHHMVNHFVDIARDTLRENAPRLVDSIRDSIPRVTASMRENPMPTALIAIGAGWLMLRSMGYTTGSTRGYGAYGTAGTEGMPEAVGAGVDRMKGALESGKAQAKDWAESATGQVKDWTSNAAGQVKSMAGNAASQAKDWASGTAEQIINTGARVAGQVRDMTGQLAGATVEKTEHLVDYTREKAGEIVDFTVEKTEDLARATLHGAQSLGHSTRVQVSRAGESAYKTVRENPLPFAIACLGIGAALAMLIPETRQEREFMGEASDKVIGQAEAAAREEVQKIKHVAQAAQEAAVEEARREELI